MSEVSEFINFHEKIWMCSSTKTDELSLSSAIHFNDGMNSYLCKVSYSDRNIVICFNSDGASVSEFDLYNSLLDFHYDDDIDSVNELIMFVHRYVSDISVVDYLNIDGFYIINHIINKKDE